MRKAKIFIASATLLMTATADAEVNFNVNVGLPTARIMVNSPPSIRFEVAPLFIASSRLGFYVGVDTPYDIIFSSDYFYLYYGNSWHRSESHDGPWHEVPYRQLPPAIRKHRIEQIRNYRDREYRVYNEDRDNYSGRHFRPERGQSHRDLKRVKEDRRDDFRGEHEYRGNESRSDHEDRGNHRHNRGRD